MIIEKATLISCGSGRKKIHARGTFTLVQALGVQSDACTNVPAQTYVKQTIFTYVSS